MMELSMKPLERTSPEKQGVSSARILAALKALDSNENEIHGVIIAKNNCVIAESFPKPFEASFPHTCHSMGKSYTCTAIGIACTEGLMSPDDLMTDLLSEEIEAYGVTPDENFKKMRLRDVMAMAGGMTEMPGFDDSWLENFIRFPVEKEPGSWFCYNSVGSCVLGALIEKKSGESLYDYIKTRLFDKIGISESDLVWRKFYNGFYAEPGVSATTEANLRLGLFYLAGGYASGEQIVAREWMKEATSLQVDTTNQPGTASYMYGYGWQLWLGKKKGSYRFDGGQGQFCLVDPETNTVIALHEGGWHPNGVQKTLDILEDLLYDMNGKAPLPEDSDALEALRMYESSRSLPKPETKPVPEDAERFNGTYAINGNANFWMEAFPGKVEFYHMFYDPSIERNIKVLNLRLDGNVLIMTVNTRSVFRVYLDGTFHADDTYQVMPELPKTWATGCFRDEKTLDIKLHWLNSWVAYDITLELDGMNLSLTVTKGMRHEGKAPTVQHAEGRKIAIK